MCDHIANDMEDSFENGVPVPTDFIKFKLCCKHSLCEPYEKRLHQLKDFEPILAELKRNRTKTQMLPFCFVYSFCYIPIQLLKQVMEEICPLRGRSTFNISTGTILKEL